MYIITYNNCICIYIYIYIFMYVYIPSLFTSYTVSFTCYRCSSYLPAYQFSRNPERREKQAADRDLAS